IRRRYVGPPAASSPESGDDGPVGGGRPPSSSPGSNVIAPARKHSAPRAVPAFSTAALTGSALDGSTSDATAATAKATESAMLTATVRQDRDRPRRQIHRPQTSANASSLATRKQIDPKASGAQTRRFTCAT